VTSRPAAASPAITAPPVTPPAPAGAAGVFGDRLPVAERFAALLVAEGTTWGLLGPREGLRVWSRHLLNCAALSALVPSRAACLDIGSGAGLPGLALAVARPDLRVTLVEPLQRRVDFLRMAVATLQMAEQVDVVRARAEELHGRRTAPVVLARAVAPLARLVPWTLPLLAPRGAVLAMRGARARDEVAAAAALLRGMGSAAEVLELAAGDGQIATVVRVRKAT